MPNSELETPNGSQAQPSPDLATRGWEAPPGASLPTLAFPDISTPGPHAPGRATLAETTEAMAHPRGQVSRLPPIPGYEVERFVGRGGMGVVYRATHTATGRVVALKLTNPGAAGDETTRQRFVREVHALAAIKHPNIVPVYDAGEWHGFAYCTMEYVDGGTLNQHLDRLRADLPMSVRLVVKVARAIEALHAAGILHRDLKPLNILLGANDEPMVADFGLAKWMDDDSDLTHTGLPVGTRQYMSPEQTLGKKQSYTAACDVWAMGVTLYELLTGHRPFNDDGITDVYHSIRTTEPPPMTALSPNVPAPLQAVVSKCLAKKPEERYSTAAALADDLDRWLNNEPVSVPLPVPVLVPEIVKKPRRRRVLMTASIVAVLAVLAVVFFRKPAEADVQPPVVPDPVKTVVAEPVKPLAERIAAGERVKLTDDKGWPLVTPVYEPGHKLEWDTLEGFHLAKSSGVGIASFSDEALDVPYRVEADVAMQFVTLPNARAGVYVGRRMWPGLAIKHESLVWVGIHPQLAEKNLTEWELRNSIEVYWWKQNSNGSRYSHHDETMKCDRDGKRESVRFAHVVIDVRTTSVTASIDDIPLKPLSDLDTADWLNRNKQYQQKALKFPDYDFRAPTFGNGIGIFCQDGQCVVRNLTVSKLPNP